MATVNSIGGNLPIKPSSTLLSSGVQSTWVLGKSSRGSGLRTSKAPAIVVSDNFAFHELHTPLTVVDVPSIKVGEDHHGDEARAIEGHKSGFIGKAEVDLGMGIAESSPMSSVLGSRAMVMPMGLGPKDTDHHRNQFVDQNQFALLLELGNGMDFVSWEKDAFMEGLSVNGDQWCNPQDECVPSSDRDELELFKGGFKALLLQWKHSGTNTGGPFPGEAESGLLECSPLSRWDPFEQRELEVTQEVDEGEVLGSEVKILKWVVKWVVNLMKSCCKKLWVFPLSRRSMSGFVSSSETRLH